MNQGRVSTALLCQWRLRRRTRIWKEEPNTSKAAQTQQRAMSGEGGREGGSEGGREGGRGGGREGGRERGREIQL